MNVSCLLVIFLTMETLIKIKWLNHLAFGWWNERFMNGSWLPTKILKAVDEKQQSRPSLDVFVSTTSFNWPLTGMEMIDERPRTDGFLLLLHFFMNKIDWGHTINLELILASSRPHLFSRIKKSFESKRVCLWSNQLFDVCTQFAHIWIK